MSNPLRPLRKTLRPLRLNFSLIFFFLFPFLVFSQSEKLSDNIISIAEELAADDSDPSAITSFTDRLHELSENPVKINSGDKDDISRLFFLSDFQVKAIADYVTSSGAIVSPFEISNIPGFDKETASMIVEFITLDNQPKKSENYRIKSSLISNFSTRKGSDDSTYLGSDWKMLTKYKLSCGGFSGGITMEKDAGEKFLAGNPPLPDFLSGYMAFTGSQLVRRIIVGDFSARFGQGSNINTGIRRGMSLTSPGYMSASDEIKPYTSSGENIFFRGIATELGYHNIGIMMFFSKNYIDATLESSTGTGNDYIKTLLESGIHNTATLLNKKDNVSSMSYGLDFFYNFSKLKAGIIYSTNKFSLPVRPGINEPENIFDFKGTRNDLLSVYYNTFIKKILFFGELTLNDYKKQALIQGISMRPADRLTINLLLRGYSPGFSSIYGKAPGISSKNSNEKGVLGSFSYEAFRHFFIYAGFDFHEYPWLKYRCDAPSKGTRSEMKIKFVPSDFFVLEASYNFRKSMIDIDVPQGIHNQDQIVTRSFKITTHYKAHNNLIFGSRVDYKALCPSHSHGFNLCQDINYTFNKLPVTIWIRYCIFNTDDWSSGIYTYENDLLYCFSIPALYGEGARSYMMARWKIGRSAEVRVKYGLTSMSTRDKNADLSEIKMQFRIAF